MRGDDQGLPPGGHGGLAHRRGPPQPPRGKKLERRAAAGGGRKSVIATIFTQPSHDAEKNEEDTTVPEAENKTKDKETPAGLKEKERKQKNEKKMTGILMGKLQVITWEEQNKF